MKGCFGCFKMVQAIISLIVITIIALIILFPCGGLDYIKDFVNSRMHPAETEVQIKARRLGDFSKIPKGYKLTRAVSMLGANAVIGENVKTKQKMVVLDPGWILSLSKADINPKTMDAELRKLATRFSSQPVKLSNLQVGKQGSFKAFNQSVPYIRVKAGLTGNTNRNMEGIIGVINDPNSKNKLVVSFSEVGKYQQKTAEDYFKTIKLSTTPVNNTVQKVN